MMTALSRDLIHGCIAPAGGPTAPPVSALPHRDLGSEASSGDCPQNEPATGAKFVPWRRELLERSVSYLAPTPEGVASPSSVCEPAPGLSLRELKRVTAQAAACCTAWPWRVLATSDSEPCTDARSLARERRNACSNRATQGVQEPIDG